MSPEMIERTKYFLALADKTDAELQAEHDRLEAQRKDDLRRLHRVREVQEQRAAKATLTTEMVTS